MEYFILSKLIFFNDFCSEQNKNIVAVTDLTDEEFDKAIRESEKVVVKYYAGWCGTCRLLAPKFKRLSEEEQFADVVFLDVNAEHNPHARNIAGVSNLPFIATFKEGKILEATPAAKIEKVRELVERL